MKGIQFPWREAGPPNHLDDRMNSDQSVVNKEVSLCRVRPLSSEFGTDKTVKARFWPWLSDKSPETPLSYSLFALFAGGATRTDFLLSASGLPLALKVRPNPRFFNSEVQAGTGEFAYARREMAHIPGLDWVQS